MLRKKGDTLGRSRKNFVVVITEPRTMHSSSWSTPDGRAGGGCYEFARNAPRARAFRDRGAAEFQRWASSAAKKLRYVNWKYDVV